LTTYRIGLIQELELPSHCAIGVIVRISWSSHSLGGGPNLTRVKMTYKGSHDIANRTTTSRSILITFILDLSNIISKLIREICEWVGLITLPIGNYGMFKIKMEKFPSNVIWRYICFFLISLLLKFKKWPLNRNSKLTIMEVHFDFWHTVVNLLITCVPTILWTGLSFPAGSFAWIPRIHSWDLI